MSFNPLSSLNGFAVGESYQCFTYVNTTNQIGVTSAFTFPPHIQELEPVKMMYTIYGLTQATWTQFDSFRVWGYPPNYVSTAPNAFSLAKSTTYVGRSINANTFLKMASVRVPAGSFSEGVVTIESVCTKSSTTPHEVFDQHSSFLGGRWNLAMFINTIDSLTGSQLIGICMNECPDNRALTYSLITRKLHIIEKNGQGEGTKVFGTTDLNGMYDLFNVPWGKRGSIVPTHDLHAYGNITPFTTGDTLGNLGGGVDSTIGEEGIVLNTPISTPSDWYWNPGSVTYDRIGRVGTYSYSEFDLTYMPLIPLVYSPVSAAFRSMTFQEQLNYGYQTPRTVSPQPKLGYMSGESVPSPNWESDDQYIIIAGFTDPKIYGVESSHGSGQIGFDTPGFYIPKFTGTPFGYAVSGYTPIRCEWIKVSGFV